MKRKLIFLLGVILISSFVFAQSNSTSTLSSDQDKIDKAYACLKDQIEQKTSFSLQDAVFGTLALGNEKKLKDKIDEEKRSNEECWPKSGCTIKDTSQVVLALDRSNSDESAAKNWLVSKGISARDLTWYLEIDISGHVSSECTIKYDNREQKIKVREDMKLEGNAGSCLEIDYGGYWLKINNNCLEKEFTVSCDKDFITSLIYQNADRTTVFVSSETHSSVSLGSTTEKVNSKCFATGTKCDYEGTLWATLALSKAGEDIEAYLPYLFAYSSQNQKYLPSSFLYILTGADDRYSELVQLQKMGKYWEIIGGSYNRFYDSSLAMLSLGGTSASELDSARSYLLDLQTKEGCWNNNNIRDSAFILYSGWPKQSIVKGVVGNGGDKLCSSAGYYCEESDNCLNSGGAVLREFDCTNFREVCCTQSVQGATCDQKNGLICSSSQRCTGRLESSIDGSCCLEGACENIQSENLCVISGGICKGICGTNEEESDQSCQSSSDVCCVEVEIEESSSSVSTALMILLGILILLVVIAIIFRRKLQMWWHSRKRDKGTSAPNQLRRLSPPGMPPGMMARSMPRYGPPGQRSPVRGGPSLRQSRGPKTQEDKEMEETMKKLKEMSK